MKLLDNVYFNVTKVYIISLNSRVISEDGDSMEIDTTSGSKLPGAEEEKVGVGSGAGSDDKEMEAMLQNPEFLHSVLSSLPGVNPEEALQNLEEISKVVEDQKKKDGGLFVLLSITRFILRVFFNF